MNCHGITLPKTLATCLLAALALVLAGCGQRAQRGGTGAQADGQIVQRDDERSTDAGRPLPMPRPTDGDERAWEVERPAPTQTQQQSRPLPVPAEPTLVRQGSAPLVYLVERPMTVSVVDLASGQRLARGSVGARTIVRVEARGGVIFGERRVLPGPLPAEHRFGIYLEPPDAASEIQTETVAPAPGPRMRQPVRQPDAPAEPPREGAQP